MARILMLGGGVCGLSAGMLLARDGHEVTVLERDAAPSPESLDAAWETWSRDGVKQFRQAHFLATGGHTVLEEELPDVLEALIAAGASRFNPLTLRPPTLGDDGGQPADERFVTFTARRPTIEFALAGAAEAEPGVDVRRGVAVRELVMQERDGTPHVTGARVDSGEVLEADLVVDAMGRGSQLPRWLDAAGAGPVHEESEDSGFIYYTRFFRSAGSAPRAVTPLLCPIGSFSILTLPGDNDTWSVTTYVSSGDRPLKRMREPDAWTAVVSACPLHAHWLDGEPIGELEAMGGVVDRYRRLLVDGRPAVTGLALLGDAFACTNPSLGRGISLGLMHARCLRDAARTHLDDAAGFAEAFDAVTEEQLTPWYRETVAEDRERLREIEALREGHDPPGAQEPEAVLRAALLGAMFHDPELFLAYLESRCCMTTLSETFAREGVPGRILALASDRQAMPFPGPSREDLLRLLA